MTRIPDIAGELVGFRAWLVETSPRVALYSLGRQVEWPGDDWTRATCERCDDLPGERCSCGIYCARDAPHLYGLRYYDHGGDEQVTVVGELALAGKVIPGTQGFRAEKARVLHLWVPWTAWELVAPLRRRYGVAVELANTLKPPARQEVLLGHR